MVRQGGRYPAHLAAAVSGSSLRQACDTALNRVNSGLRAVARVQFVQHATYVGADGLLGDAEFGCDVAVAEATSDESQNRQFARSELGGGSSFRQAVTQGRQEIADIAADSLNGIEQLIAARVLRQVTHGAVAQGAEHVFTSLAIAQNDDARGVIEFADRA